MKNIFKFIIIVLIILAVYICFIFNIHHFITSYDEKFEKLENPYAQNIDKVTIFDIANISNTAEMLEENILSIKNGNIIKNILLKFCDIQEESYYEYIDKLYEEGIMKKIEYMSGQYAIYIKETNYELIFSLNFENIAYRMIVANSQADVFLQYEDITNENREKIYKIAKEDCKELGITEKYNFEPQSIHVKYFNEYVIEDNENKIQLEYELSSGQLQKIQIGFMQMNYKV